MRIFVSVLALAALSAPPSAFAAILTTDDDIRRALIGNTITGVEDGRPFTEYLKPDGTIVGEDREGRYTGHWLVAGAQICLRYEDDGKEGNWECLRVDLSGSNIRWLSEDDETFATLTPGNPSRF